MSEIAKWPPEFLRIEQKSELERFLHEGGSISASITIWTKHQTVLLNSMLTLYNKTQGVLYMRIPKGVTPSTLMNELARQNERECFFNLSLSRAIVFFKAEYDCFDEAHFIFKIPVHGYKVQRRRDFRFSLPPGHALKVEFRDPLFPTKKMVRKVIDLSAGGLSFLIPDDETHLFTSGLILKEIEISIRGRKIRADGEVKHLRSERGEKRNSGARVGIRFFKLKESETQLLASYIFDENRKFYSKFM